MKRLVTNISNTLKEVVTFGDTEHCMMCVDKDNKELAVMQEKEIVYFEKVTIVTCMETRGKPRETIHRTAKAVLTRIR
jgi:hypothetical protein